MKIFFRILDFARPFRSFLPEYIIQAVLAVVFGVFNFSLLVPLLNVLFGTMSVPAVVQKPQPAFSGEFVVNLFNYHMYSLIKEEGPQSALVYVCCIILCFIFLSNLFKYTSQRVLTRMRVNVLRNIRAALFVKFSDMYLGQLHAEKKGNLMSIMSNDVQEIESSVVSSFQVVFREPLLIVGYFIFLFNVSFQLTIFTVFFIPATGLIINFISRRLKRKAHDGQKLLGNILTLTDEALTGLRVVKVFNAQAFFRERFRKENEHFRNLLKSIVNKRELSSPVSEFLGVLAAVGIILYGGSMVLNNTSELSASQFITYIVIFSQILAPAKNMASATANIQKGLAAAERVFEILDAEDPIREEKNTRHIRSMERELTFENVSFAYGNEPVLNEIDFKLERGKVLALVGPSGAGKSTIIDLIVRFYDVGSGAIKIDGNDIRTLKLSELRGLVGMVSQETILFNDTVFNNIAFGKTDATTEEVEEAARIANAHEFILQTEEGYQTKIGDRGMKLSGGQRQRLSIARAVLRNPAILILDEATSALDTESEKLVQDAISKLMKDRTSIVIAHRLSTVQDADQILVLDKGRIVQRGSHTSLLAQGGLYKRLVDLQSL